MQTGAMGSLGRIATLDDLPSDQRMLTWLRQATAFMDAGNYTSPIKARHRVAKAAKPEPKLETATATDLLTAIAQNKRAQAVYTAFSPSCKREYVEWITTAKRPETRATRIATAVAWMEEGKQRNWKYQVGKYKGESAPEAEGGSKRTGRRAAE